MNPPKKIKVGGGYVTIAKKELANGDFGMYHNTTSLVEYSNDLDETQTKMTILHEVLHALFFERGLRLHVTKEQEEVLVSAMENGLFALMRDNPKFVQYLMEA